jgi:hypothetical protein
MKRKGYSGTRIWKPLTLTLYVQILHLKVTLKRTLYTSASAGRCNYCTTANLRHDAEESRIVQFCIVTKV